MLLVGEFELVDHGIDNPQYFQGCGTSFTKYEYCATGCGDNPVEALDDLLEMVSQHCGEGDQFFDTEGLEARILADLDLKEMPDHPSALQEMLEANDCGEAPQRENFASDDEFETAQEEFEIKVDEIAQECENNYYLSLRWNAK